MPAVKSVTPAERVSSPAVKSVTPAEGVSSPVPPAECLRSSRSERHPVQHFFYVLR